MQKHLRAAFMDEKLQIAVLMILGLQLKHIICDGPLQTVQMVRDKSIYGKSQGVAHAAIHIAGSFVVFLLSGLPLEQCLGLAALDGVIHYHADFVKENVVKFKKWGTTDGPFWWALTTDQAVHHMTYVLLVWLALKP
jgi:Protein of unknown function (DUF3307)